MIGVSALSQGAAVATPKCLATFAEEGFAISNVALTVNHALNRAVPHASFSPITPASPRVTALP